MFLSLIRRLVCLYFISTWSVGSFASIQVTEFKWKYNGDNTGIVTAVTATMLDDTMGPCGGTPNQKTCKFFLGDSNTPDPINVLKVIFSGTNVAENNTRLLSAVNSINGAVFDIHSDSPAVCLTQSTSATTFVGAPGGVCNSGSTPPEPTKATCKVNGDVIIDYGSLSTDSLSGMHKTGSTTVTCNQDATVNLRVYNTIDNTNTISLRDDNSLYANVTVNGKDISVHGKNIKVKANTPKTVTIDSELKVSGVPSAGDFNGSAIAIISIP